MVALARYLLAGVGLATGAFVLGSTLLYVHASHVPGPVHDFWHVFELFEAIERGEAPWSHLWAFHGGHRLIVPRLLHLVEYRWFEGRNVFLIATSLLLQLSLVALVLRAVWQERDRLGRPTAWFLTGFVPACAYSSSQLQNFVRPWNVHWFLALAGAAGSLALLLRAASEGRAESRGRAGAFLGASFALALLASASMANGLLVWPLLVLVGAAAGLRIPVLSAIAGAGLAVGGAYFQGLPPGTRQLDGSGLVASASWWLACLGGPLSWDSAAAGKLLAGAGIAAGAALSLRLAFLRTRACRGGELFLMGLLLFCGGSVALVAFGRARMFPESWAEPRYQSIVLWFWACLAAFALIRLSSGGRRSALLRSAFTAVACAWLLGVLLPAHVRGARDAAEFARRARATQVAVVMGVDLPGEYAYLLPFSDEVRRRSGHPDRVVRHRDFLQRHALGFFARRERDLLGAHLRAIGPEAAPAACHGAVLRVSRLDAPSGPFLRVVGRAWDATAGSPPRLVLLADEGGRVVGLGHPLERGFRARTRRGWLGYAQAREERLSVWALLDEGGVCPIAIVEGPTAGVTRDARRARAGDPRARRGARDRPRG